MAAGDLTAAAEAWDELVINNFDRVKQTVKAFRFSAGSKGIPEFDQGSAVSEAFLRVQALGANFRKHEIEAFYAALAQTVRFACRDFGRKELRHDKRTAGSLDQRFDPESEVGPYSGALAAWEKARHEDAADRLAHELEQQRQEDLIAWAISRINNDKHREVLELTFNDKLDAEAIAQHLAITKENAYQRRSRGWRELEKILRELDA